MKSIVYTMASSGMRLGAWDYLKWGHVKPVYENGEVLATMIRVYAEEDDEYLTFVSGEAYSAMLDWMDFPKRSGETVNSKSSVLRNLSDSESRGQGIAECPQTIEVIGCEEVNGACPIRSGCKKEIREREETTRISVGPSGSGNGLKRSARSQV